jgi:ABC-type transporter Mla MlaB component
MLLKSNNDRWALSGELSFVSLTRANVKSAFAKRPARGEWTIDVSSVEKCDSAGLAFLVRCVREAKAGALTLSFSGLSASLLQLAGAQGVDHLLQGQ